jgi:hypothetical protein
MLKNIFFLILVYGLCSQDLEAMETSLNKNKKNKNSVELPTQAASSSSVKKSSDQDEVVFNIGSIDRAKSLSNFFKDLYKDQDRLYATKDEKKIIDALCKIDPIIKNFQKRVDFLKENCQKATRDDYAMFCTTARQCDIIFEVIDRLYKKKSNDT